MPEYDRFAITTNTPSKGCHQITIGDTNISNSVTAADIALRPGLPPTVELGLTVWESDPMSIDGPAVVDVDERTHAALVALGWTPPAPAAEPTEEQRLADVPPAVVMLDSGGDPWLVCRRCHEELEPIDNDDWLETLVAVARQHDCPEPADTPEESCQAVGSELRSIAARLLHLRTHLDDDPHDEELRRAVVRLRDLSDGATPRPPQAAGDANDPGDDAGAAYEPAKPAAAESEPRVHYEIEAYTDGWSIPIHTTRSLNEARAHEGVPGPVRTRIVRVTREVIQ